MGCKMISLDTYEGKSLVLLGFFMSASCVFLVRIANYSSLDATTSKLMVEDKLVSTSNPYFKFKTFPYPYSGVATQGYDLSARDALPIDPAINHMANCNTPLSRVPLFHPNGFLKLSDQNQSIHPDNISYTFMDNTDVLSAQLLYSGKQVLKNQSGTEVWNSFNNNPFMTLLPGQAMKRNQGHKPVLIKKTTFLDANDTYGAGGLRILQHTINQTVTLNQTSNEHWKVVANWVVADRPDSRSRCAAFGACGPYSELVSPLNPLEPVTCRCLGSDNPSTKGWFTPIDVNDPAKGCQPPSQRADCPNEDGVYVGTSNPVGMLELPGVDMLCGEGGYRNLTGNAFAGCKEACALDCHCSGAVFSRDERLCWLRNGVLFGVGYPTVALHGTDRTSFLRNQTAWELSQPRAVKKDNKLVKILVWASVGAGVLLFIVAVFCLWRYERVRQRLWACACCGSCCRRPKPCYEIRFPGDTPMRAEPGDGDVELQVVEREPAVYCTCTIQCSISSNHSRN